MKSPTAGKMPDFRQVKVRERIHKDIRYRSDADAWLLGGALDCIAALEVQIARLTAPVTETEVVDMVGTYIAAGRGPDAGHAALTAFLEGRVKG